MDKHRKIAVLVMTAVVGPVGWTTHGCASPTPNPWLQQQGHATRHGLAGEATPQRSAWLDLSSYWPVEASADRLFLRSEPDRPFVPKQPYRQLLRSWGQMEGTMIGRDAHPIDRFLDPHSTRPDRPRLDWPARSTRAEETVFLEFQPPLIEWPHRMRMGEPHTQEGRFTLFNAHGLPFAYGRAIRRTYFDGYEAIAVSGGQGIEMQAVPSEKRLSRPGVTQPPLAPSPIVTPTVRMFAVTDLHISWWLAVRLEERVWLAPGAGIVRRWQRIRGTALLFFPVYSQHHFNLAGDMAPQNRAGGQSRRSGPSHSGTPHEGRWHHLAIHFDQVLPHPQVAGLVVDWALDEGAPEAR